MSSEALALVRRQLRDQLRSRVDARGLASAPRTERRVRVREEALELLRASGAILPQRELTRMVNEVSDDVVGFGPIEFLLKDPDVTEVMVNGCVSCGACVQACPTDALVEKSTLEKGVAERSVITTCGYCGVGCSFKAEVKGDQVVRMLPNKDGMPNHGHSCVKGRFAWGYATHPDRVLTPMVREKTSDPWRKVSWEEAIGYAAKRLKEIQSKYGAGSIGGITSSRCTNEETYLVQKMVRAAFGNNNVDTCARVCHSPTGYGLKTTLGTSAGTQDFDSVLKADVILVIGCNPTDGHPVFASLMKRRLRQGAKLSSSPTRARSISCARRISRPSIICRSCRAPTSR